MNICMITLHSLALTATETPDLVFPLVWLGVLVAALAIEGCTSELVSIWFAPGALVAMILSFFVPDFTTQLIVFIIPSVLLLIMAKTVFKKRLAARHKKSPTGAEALPGQLAVVEEDIDNEREEGVVRINGQLWTARCVSDSDKPLKGAHVDVVQVAGTKLIVKPHS